MSAFRIDGFDFCRTRERREGRIPVANLPRLAAELIDAADAGSLDWSAQGGSDRLGNPQLTLAVAGQVKLRCQRCLQAMDHAIDSEAVLVLARDEAVADEIEALLDDESVDVIVGSRDMDLQSLAEDEALLSLPLSPRHETCPGQVLVEDFQAPKKESPFAVLKALKNKS